MNSWTWKQCSIEACRQLNELGLVLATKPRSIQNWNLEFRKCRIFLQPNHMVRCVKPPFPMLFMKYPAAKDQIAAFGLSYLSIHLKIYGQDKSVFSQFLFPSKAWVGPNKERGLFPKSLGEGLMISAFVSRNTGFGMPETDRELAIVNALWQGAQHIDGTAALEV